MMNSLVSKLGSAGWAQLEMGANCNKSKKVEFSVKEARDMLTTEAGSWEYYINVAEFAPTSELVMLALCPSTIGEFPKSCDEMLTRFKECSLAFNGQSEEKGLRSGDILRIELFNEDMRVYKNGKQIAKVGLEETSKCRKMAIVGRNFKIAIFAGKCQ